MTLAMDSKLFVASAKIVGPAPDRQIPSSPGCVWGDMEDKIEGKAGMSPAR